MRAVFQLPIDLAPPFTTGQGSSRGWSDVALEVGFPFDHGVAELRGILILQLLRGRENVSRSQVLAECDGYRRFPKTYGGFKDDKPLGFQCGFDFSEDGILGGSDGSK